MIIFTLIFLSFISSVNSPTPNSPDFCYQYYEKNKFHKAHICFDRLYKKEKNKDFLYGSAYSSYMGKEYNTALSLINKYLLLTDKKGDALFLKGLILEKKGLLNSAKKAFIEAKNAGLQNESSDNLKSHLSKVKKSITINEKSDYDISLTTGYDSKPYASDLGEIISSDEAPSVFLGVGASIKLPILVKDYWKFDFIYSGNWRLFISSDSFSKGKNSTAGQGRMMTSSSGPFGYSSNDLGFSLKHGPFQATISGILRSFDPLFQENLSGIQTAIAWQKKGKYDRSFSLTFSDSVSLSDTLDSFAGFSFKSFYLQEIPSPGSSVTFLSFRGSYSNLGTSTNIECDSTDGCPLEIPWDFFTVGTNLITTIPFSSLFIGAEVGYQYFHQLQKTTIDGANSPFYRSDHKISTSLWFKFKKSPAWKISMELIHNMSNADYLYYDLNYTRFIASISVEW